MKILYISDIHFRGSYVNQVKTNEIFADFLNDFVETVAREEISYVLIGGDIAFSGKDEDYLAFENLVVNELISRFESPPIVFGIPGNHDVLWTGIPKTILEGRSSDIVERFKKKNDLFTSNYIDHRSQEVERFIHFSQWQERMLSRAVSEKIIETSLIENDYLFGYVQDEANKVVFILLNSAWLSWGGGFDELLREYIRDPGRPDFNADELINIKNNTVEFGGQIIGGRLLNELAMSMERWSDYTVITALHHPLHWLEWSEYNSYLRRDISRSNLYKILARSDIFLTGHEHVSEFVKPRMVNYGGDHDTLYIQSGMFLQDKVEPAGNLTFPHNRFSIFEIGRKQVVERRFLFSNESSRWIESNVKGRSAYAFTRPDKLNCKLDSFDEAKDRFWKEKAKIVQNYFHGFQVELLEFDSGISSDFQWYSFPRDPELSLVLVTKISNFFLSILQTDSLRESFFASLTDIIRSSGGRGMGEIRLNFFTLDLYGAPGLVSLYSQDVLSEDERSEIFKQIIKQADHEMDKFRVEFFRHILSLHGDHSSGVKWSEISLANSVKSHWNL